MLKEKASNLYALYKKYVNVLVVILVAAVSYLLMLNAKSNLQVGQLTGRLNTERRIFSVWKDSIGREHAQIKVVTEYVTQLQPVIKSKLDTAAAVLKVAQTDIKAITEVIPVTKNVIVTRIDTNRALTFTDGYLTLNGQYEDSTFRGDYTYRDRLHHVVHIKRKKFLGITVKKEQFVDVYFDNPATRIENAEHISLKELSKPKRWGLGVSAGATYHTGSVRPYVGVGLNYNLINW